MKLWQKLALMGGIAATGGLLAPAALSALGVGAAASGGAVAGAGGLLGGGIGSMGSAALAPSLLASTATTIPTGFASGVGGSSLGGLLGSALGSAGTATMGLNAAKNLISDDPMQPAQMRQGSPAGPQTVAQIYESGQQSTQNQLDQAAQERMKRRQMWG